MAEALSTQLVESEGPGVAEGAGVVSDVVDVWGSQSGGEFAANSAVYALSALGAIKDPFQTAVSAGVGYLIEHIDFLREPLDALAGDPGQIEAHAKSWQNVATTLEKTAQQRSADLGAVSGWQGEAADAYRKAAAEQAKTITDAAGAADQLSQQVLAAGAAVGTVRALIRDTIADFVAKVVERLLMAVATAVPTLGGSVGVVIADIVLEASALAAKLASKLSELLSWLAKSAKALEGLAGKIDDLTKGLGSVGDRARAAAPGHVRGAAGDQLADMKKAGGLPLDAAQESWKQYEKADTTRDEWNER
ncbi:hypothetical protein [Pseudonocardia spinosispora]|uniref:WXG100-like domain-containing protein n=1 Tax=Pseudonocardia spinosispora TaxID=103441 RepID=UPI00041BCB3B|nr:hypothetical protein [Pseudonocardia spinosispora]